MRERDCLLLFFFFLFLGLEEVYKEEERGVRMVEEKEDKVEDDRRGRHCRGQRKEPNASSFSHNSNRRLAECERKR
jgi:hypothetical protein